MNKLFILLLSIITINIYGQQLQVRPHQLNLAPLYIDTLNSRVGIGTSSPQGFLSIEQDFPSSSTLGFTVSDPRYSGLVQFKTNSSSFFFPALEGYTGTSTSLPLSLDIIGSIDTSQDVLNTSFSVIRIQAREYDNFPFGFSGVENANVFSVVNSGSTLMMITANGNVGIGTSFPLHRLDVNGALRLRQINNTPYSATLIELGDRNGTWSYGINFNQYYDGLWKYRETDYSAGIAFDFNGNLRFNTTPSGSADSPITISYLQNPKLFISNGGNVGIGTATPSYKLDVYQGDVATTGHVGGDLRLSGNLSGYANNTYPTLKTNTSAIHFDALGTYTGYISWNSGFVDVSDGTLKTFVEPIQNATDILMNLEGVRYSWADGRDNYATHAGFVAQQVLNHYPEAVTLAETGIYGISSPPLIALAVTTIQEQQAIIEEQSNKIQTLESQILLILQEIDNLKNK